MIHHVDIVGFKRIDSSSVDLAKINVLVGGNNSGKSCFLQGIHLGVTLSQSQRIAGSQQFPPEQLRYCPTDDFLNLRHDSRLTEGTAIVFHLSRHVASSTQEATISLTRGRNGVVKATSLGDLVPEISDPKGFFSIYVRG
jgi:AAA15 family ATPase/GTPase